jgi:hypothetical protein
MDFVACKWQVFEVTEVSKDVTLQLCSAFARSLLQQLLFVYLCFSFTEVHNSLTGMGTWYNTVLHCSRRTCF